MPSAFGKCTFLKVPKKLSLTYIWAATNYLESIDSHYNEESGDSKPHNEDQDENKTKMECSPEHVCHLPGPCQKVLIFDIKGAITLIWKRDKKVWRTDRRRTKKKVVPTMLRGWHNKSIAVQLLFLTFTFFAPLQTYFVTFCVCINNFIYLQHFHGILPKLLVLSMQIIMFQ